MYCNFKFEPQIRQISRLFYRQLFNSVNLVAIRSFFGWQLLRQRSDRLSDCRNAFFLPCEYASRPFWQMAVQYAFSFTVLGVCPSPRPRTGINVYSIKSKSSKRQTETYKFDKI